MQMTRKLALAVGLATSALMTATVLAAPMTAQAHHSFAMFDRNKEVALKDAAVAKWEWTNPHTWLYLYVPNGTATPDRYALEGGNPGVLRRQGYGIGTFKPGDKITAYMSPLLSGETGGTLLAAVLPDGSLLGQRLQKEKAAPTN
jgi:hypothetical protein